MLPSEFEVFPSDLHGRTIGPVSGIGEDVAERSAAMRYIVVHVDLIGHEHARDVRAVFSVCSGQDESFIAQHCCQLT